MIEYLNHFYSVDQEKAAALEAKRQAAIEKLGKNWIMHPEYKFNPKHSMTGSKKLTNKGKKQ